MTAGRAPLIRQMFQVFLCSLALMLFEINLVRLFSVIMYYHLAFFVLAVALFGIGVGGLCAQLLRARQQARGASFSAAPYLPVLLALSIVVGTVILAMLPFQSGSAEYQVPRIRWVFLAFLVSAAPFFFGSMYMSSIFASRPADANRLYFGDLIGAGLACILAIPLLNWFGGMTALFLVACIGVIPTFLGGLKRRRTAVLAACTVLAVGVVLGSGNYASAWLMRAAKGSPLGTPLLFSKWNIYSRIGVQPAPEWNGWRLSENYHGPVPDHLKITQDGRAPAFIVNFDGNFDKVDYLKYDVTAIPYYLTTPKSVLVIGAGGGRDLLTAKLYGVPEVAGVELNPITSTDVMRDAFRDYSGDVYDLPGVHVATENGRTFVHHTDKTYDVILMSLADTQSASAQGASILSENHLYTKEAFQSYWERLSPDGLCCFVGSTLWDGHLLPRLANTMRAALEEEGVPDPGKHILAVVTPKAGRTTAAQCLVLSKKAVDEQMVQRALSACNKLGYTLAWPPAGAPNEWNAKVAPIFEPPAQRAQHLDASDFDLSPLRDDRPYLFYAAKPRNFFSLLLNPKSGSPEFVSQMGGLHFVIDLFLVAFLCVLVLMVSPLLLFRRRELTGKEPGIPAFLSVFFLLGIGYILIEVAILQRFFLLLGSPTLTFAVTLFAMLTFSGVGSLWSGKFATPHLPRTIRRVVVVLVAIQLVSLWAVPVLVEKFLPYSLGVRFLVVVGALALMATPMGMLFPCAIRYLGYRNLDMTCWSWGMNGIGSVLGSVGATVIALNLGIHAASLVGVACYALVGFVAPFLRERATAPARQQAVTAAVRESATP